MRLAGMTSGRGRNVLHLAALEPGGAEVAVIVTDDPEAPVLDTAEEREIPTEILELSNGKGGKRVEETLAAYDVDLVCLDGYEPGLSADILGELPPALTVEYGLTDPEERSDETRVSGATIRLVGDNGAVLAQEPVPVYEGDSEEALRERLVARGSFRAYPRVVRWFTEDAVELDEASGRVNVETDASGDLPARYLEGADRLRELRYGENPHQDAAIYVDYTSQEASVVGADQLNEDAKALSYNNYNDADAALNLVTEFDEPAAAVIKHTNPAGCVAADSISAAYDRALSTDPKSAFGGVVALNRECDADTAETITDSFKEVVVAPGYTDEALAVLREKDNLRVLAVGELGGRVQKLAEKHLVGGRLVQERDHQRLTRADLEVVTEREPTDEEYDSLLFAWQVVKHVKSNAIVFASGTETVGVGAGQVSRVDAVELAGKKADRDAEGKSAEGGVMASDAFFPFPDGIEAAAETGIETVIQPGGSIRDEEVIEAADDLGLAMVHTGQRAFRHD